MTSVGSPPVDYCLGDAGKFITFVLPGGCNLNCSFCVIDQRGEVLDEPLSVEQMTQFLIAAGKLHTIFAVSIQGHEPLLPRAFPYVRALLKEAYSRSLPTTIVTNGMFLSSVTAELASLKPTKVAVSLDSPIENIHDKLRGGVGAWTSTVAGLVRAKSELSGSTCVTVSSVLLPGDHGRLQEMPELLRHLNIDEWLISPMRRIGHGTHGSSNAEAVFRKLLLLQTAADNAGIRMIVEDEFDELRQELLQSNSEVATRVYIRSLPSSVQLVRLAPSGHCSIGRDVLKVVGGSTARWIPEQIDGGIFLSLLEDHMVSG